MSTIESDLKELFDSRHFIGEGPITRARLKRSAIVYILACVTGLLPLILQMGASSQATGLGLWMPGAGFVAVGGWALLLFPATLVLFMISIVAWFWAGVVLAPLIVWLGAAVLSGLMATTPAGPLSYLLVAGCMVATAVMFRRRRASREARNKTQLAARRNFLPDSIAAVREQVQSLPDVASREMSPDQLAALRYILDRSLQPVDEFNGFTIIDQFQPAALRYQLNHMGFALGIAQGAYTPNFRGYMGQAQRNLIEKYLLRRVWSYWVYESCWGHLNFTNFDPAAKDNIMLTGWFGMQVGQYMLNSGDRRYADPESLTFRLNKKTSYPHDFHSIIGSVVDNFERSEFCLYPCEPNWLYPICNHYGMSSLAVHDALFGTRMVQDNLPDWLHKLDTEFTASNGSIIGLRSELTGIEFPFPVGEAGYSFFANCFAPERAQHLWAIARKELEPLLAEDDKGLLQLQFPGKGLDAGNYKTGFTSAYGSLLVAAREFGDDTIADASLNGLETRCDVNLEGGICRYPYASNLANATAVLGKLMGTGDFRRSFVAGPGEQTLSGPVLAEAPYPDVLVARAYSTGHDLDLVLYPGKDSNSRVDLRISQLKPDQRYKVTGAGTTELKADAKGGAVLTLSLEQKTRIHVTPDA